MTMRKQIEKFRGKTLGKIFKNCVKSAFYYIRLSSKKNKRYLFLVEIFI